MALGDLYIHACENCDRAIRSLQICSNGCAPLEFDCPNCKVGRMRRISMVTFIAMGGNLNARVGGLWRNSANGMYLGNIYEADARKPIVESRN